MERVGGTERIFKKRWPVATAVVTAAAAVSLVMGCGGSAVSTGAAVAKSSATTQAAAPSKRVAADLQFIASADVVCRELNTALGRDRGGQAPSAAVGVTLRHAALERATVERLRKLAPPASIAGDWKRMNGYRQTLADQLVRLAKAFQRSNTTGRRALAASKLLAHRGLFGLATRDGFKDCTQVGTSFKPSAASPPPGGPSLTRGLLGGL